MPENTNDNVFSTRDLALAATLMTLKFRLEGTDFQYEGSKREPIGYFRFTNTETLKDARQRYMQSMLQVEPQLFVSNMRALKAEVANWAKNPHQKTF